MAVIDKFQARWEELICTRAENIVLRKACDALVVGLIEISNDSSEQAVKEKAVGVVEMVLKSIQGEKA